MLKSLLPLNDRKHHVVTKAYPPHYSINSALEPGTVVVLLAPSANSKYVVTPLSWGYVKPHPTYKVAREHLVLADEYEKRRIRPWINKLCNLVLNTLGFTNSTAKTR